MVLAACSGTKTCLSPSRAPIIRIEAITQVATRDKVQRPIYPSASCDRIDCNSLLGGKMIYKVKANVIEDRIGELYRKLTDGTIAKQRPDGNEIVASMKRAVLTEPGVAEWY